MLSIKRGKAQEGTPWAAVQIACAVIAPSPFVLTHTVSIRYNL